MMTDYSCEIPTPQSILDDDNVDVFEQAISTTTPYYAEKRLMLWARYRYVGIGNPDRTYWIQCLASRIFTKEREYNPKIKVWAEFQTRLNALQVDIDLSDGSMDSTSTVTSKRYDPPEVSTAGADATSYLDTQDSTSNTFHQETHGGLETETVRQWADAVGDPLKDWVEEFSDLFYWGM